MLDLKYVNYRYSLLNDIRYPCQIDLIKCTIYLLFWHVERKNAIKFMELHIFYLIFPKRLTISYRFYLCFSSVQIKMLNLNKWRAKTYTHTQPFMACQANRHFCVYLSTNCFCLEGNIFSLLLFHSECQFNQIHRFIFSLSYLLFLLQIFSNKHMVICSSKQLNQIFALEMFIQIQMNSKYDRKIIIIDIAKCSDIE